MVVTDSLHPHGTNGFNDQQWLGIPRPERSQPFQLTKYFEINFFQQQYAVVTKFRYQIVIRELCPGMCFQSRGKTSNFKSVHNCHRQSQEPVGLDECLALGTSALFNNRKSNLEFGELVNIAFNVNSRTMLHENLV